MGEICHKVLDIKARDIVGRLSGPDYMARVYLRQFLSDMECDRLECKTEHYGDLVGAQALLELIKKKDPRAFSAFIDALRSRAFKLEDLAEDLEAELEIQQRGCSSDGFINIPPKTPNATGPDMLLRRIPAAVSARIVRMLDIHSLNDWRAIASRMKPGLNAQDVQALMQEKMEGLLKIMFEKNMRVRDLVEILVHVDRKDVIDELKSEGLVQDPDVNSIAYEETEV